MARIVVPGPLGSIEIPDGWRKPCRRAQWNEGVRAIAQSVVVGPPKREELYYYVGVIGIWSETAMVATGKRGVIVASADQLTIVAARAFDDQGRRRADGGDAPVAFRVRVESGAGRAPPLPKPSSQNTTEPRRPLASRSGAPKGARAKSARRRAQ
jgi:hypothetical protein